jgi:hypothetical protein
MQVFISPRAPQCEALFLESKRALYLVNTFDEFLYAYGGSTHATWGLAPELQ